ncbi:peroxiredoxin [Massilia sp. 9I]|uniref:peroxiredoxin family protein n=1 Tax=Massilia sp. 9I TaxID=2653152 RepID=UPI0012F2FB1A|nr:TlpA disulfide reductase family protein [Massilia sp. 9I]VXC28913.1 Membrane protein [Massilia sp. 9I]
MTASTPSRPWIKPFAACAVVLALAGIGYASFNSGAPNVTFISISGDKISTESLRGKVVMVNFWATDCRTCVKEMPQMVETYNKYKGQGLEFIAVAMQYDPPNYVLNFTEAHKLPFKVALDSAGDIAKQFGDVKMTPTTFVIDKNGKIIKRYLGEPPFPELHKLLEKELTS